MAFLQVIVSVLFFIQKIFLVFTDKKFGWLIGVIAAVFGVFYFYHLDMMMYVALEASTIILMGYGFLKNDGSSIKIKIFVGLVTSISMLALAISAFVGIMTIVEFISTSSFLAGTYLILYKKLRWGWFLFVIGHVFSAVLGWEKDQNVFLVFQILSAAVSVYAVKKFKNQEPR